MTLRDPADCPYYLISRACLAITSRLKRELAESGVHRVRPSYLGVLLALWREDRLKAVDLGRRAGLEPSTMTSLLDRMEADELVVRTADPDDRRVQRIQLTAEGRRVRGPVLSVVDRALEKVLAGVGEADLAVMKDTLRRVLANADKGRSG
jgi:DNA-binding MarR family transcriptional regulator